MCHKSCQWQEGTTVEGAKPGQCRLSSITQFPRECPQPGKLGCWAWAEGTLLLRIVRDPSSRGTRAGMKLGLISQLVYNNCYKYRYILLLHTLRACFCCWSLRSLTWPPGFDTAKIKRRQHNDGTLAKVEPAKSQDTQNSAKGKLGGWVWFQLRKHPENKILSKMALCVSEPGSTLQEKKIRQMLSRSGRLAS